MYAVYSILCALVCMSHQPLMQEQERQAPVTGGAPDDHRDQKGYSGSIRGLPRKVSTPSRVLAPAAKAEACLEQSRCPFGSNYIEKQSQRQSRSCCISHKAAATRSRPRPAAVVAILQLPFISSSALHPSKYLHWQYTLHSAFIVLQDISYPDLDLPNNQASAPHVSPPRSILAAFPLPSQQSKSRHQIDMQ